MSNIDEALERAQIRFASMTDAQIALAMKQAEQSPGVIISGALLKLSGQLAIAVEALWEYACPGLGKCPVQRMKDGSCVQERRGCGDPARQGIDAIARTGKKS